MFQELYQYTIDTLLKQAGVQSLTVPPDFARREGSMRGVPLVMTNIAYETDLLRKVRLTYMEAGDAAQILTTMAFPRFHTDLPIFGADVLAFRGQPQLIVIDHQPLFKDDPDYQARYIAPMADMHARYAHLPTNNRSLPEWTQEFFSPYTHYSRPPLSDLPHILSAYREYWDAYLAQVDRVREQPARAEGPIRSRQAQYCRNHIENEQAESMLQKLFGETWCNHFIHEFLFDVQDESPAVVEEKLR